MILQLTNIKLFVADLQILYALIRLHNQIFKGVCIYVVVLVYVSALSHVNMYYVFLNACYVNLFYQIK